MNRTKPEGINRIGGKQLFDLQVYTQENYAKAGLHDSEFAAQASQALGFPVSKGNIQGVRDAFGIVATLKAQQEKKKHTVLARLEAIEAWIRQFEGK